MALKKYAVWISDHPPTLDQKDYLETRGYDICILNSPKQGRWKNAHSLYSHMMRRCQPDIIIMVLPVQSLGVQLLEFCYNIPVYSAEMLNKDGRWYWTGRWNRITGTRYIKVQEEIPHAGEL